MLIDLVDNERQSFNPARKDLAERASPGLKAKRICLTRVIQLSHQADIVARLHTESASFLLRTPCVVYKGRVAR